MVFSVVRRELVSLLEAAAGVPKVLSTHGAGITGVPLAGPQPSVPVSTPVVLVHGYLGTAEPWGPLARRLHSAGFVNVFTLGYDSLSTSVPQLAAGLAEQVVTITTRVQPPAVHLIGHSLGGLVARYAVQRLGLDRISRTVVTVATPHRGSPLAWLGLGPAAAQLRPGSVLLRELPPLEATPQVSWAVIHAGADLVVPPPPSGQGWCIPGYGHHSIVSAPELADAIVLHLRAGEPGPGATEDPVVPQSLAG